MSYTEEFHFNPALWFRVVTQSGNPESSVENVNALASIKTFIEISQATAAILCKAASNSAVKTTVHVFRQHLCDIQATFSLRCSSQIFIKEIEKQQ